MQQIPASSNHESRRFHLISQPAHQTGHFPVRRTSFLTHSSLSLQHDRPHQRIPAGVRVGLIDRPAQLDLQLQVQRTNHQESASCGLHRQHQPAQLVLKDTTKITTKLPTMIIFPYLSSVNLSSSHLPLSTFPHFPLCCTLYNFF